MTWTTLQRSKLTEHLYGWTGGQGTPLLLIHGVGMRADYWSNLVPALSEHFALTVIDMPGHGDSPVLTLDKPSIQYYSDCIAEVLCESPEKMLVAGHSMGALISVDLAHRYAAHVKAIAVLNGIFQRAPEADAAVRGRADKLDGVSTADPTLTLERWFGATPSGVDAEAATWCKRWLLDMNPRGYQQAYTAFAYDDGPLPSSLETLQCPALFTTGELEPNSTAAMSEAMARLAPQGSAYIVGGAAHMMSMTHGDEVCDRMVEFFQGVDGSRS